MPKEDLDFLYSEGPVAEYVLTKGDAKTTLFTGSSKIAEHLVKVLNGKIKIEDSGFDWKILGPDVPKSQDMIDYVAW